MLGLVQSGFGAVDIKNLVYLWSPSFFLLFLLIPTLLLPSFPPSPCLPSLFLFSFYLSSPILLLRSFALSL